MWKIWGQTPKTLGFLVIFGFNGCAAVAALKRRGGCVAATFGVVRIRLARVALPRLGYGGSKNGVFCSPYILLC